VACCRRRDPVRASLFGGGDVGNGRRDAVTGPAGAHLLMPRFWAVCWRCF
jgi:hypothetical protein